jgi:hypothetical protein
VESPFFQVPALNQKDFTDRTWILLAESKSKIWFYDPYTLTQDENDIISFDAYFSPREKNDLAPYNATIVGPYRQKIDCFSSNQWSETFYAENAAVKAPVVGDVKPVNGSGWVKIAPRTAMAYMRTRVCGRKFLDDKNVNYFLFQEGMMTMPQAQKEVIGEAVGKEQKEAVIPSKALEENSSAKLMNTDKVNKADAADTEDKATKSPIFYEVINNEVLILDQKNDVRQLRISSYILRGHFPKQADYVFTANCQSNTFSLVAQGPGEKAGGAIGAKDSLAAVAFNRACGNHGFYMKLANKVLR